MRLASVHSAALGCALPSSGYMTGQIPISLPSAALDIVKPDGLILGSKAPYLTVWGSARVGGVFFVRARLVLQRLARLAMRPGAARREGVWIG
jgi:hypothetical protein